MRHPLHARRRGSGGRLQHQLDPEKVPVTVCANCHGIDPEACPYDCDQGLVPWPRTVLSDLKVNSLVQLAGDTPAFSRDGEGTDVIFRVEQVLGDRVRIRAHIDGSGQVVSRQLLRSPWP
jgi:hypothetical protein